MSIPPLWLAVVRSTGARSFVHSSRTELAVDEEIFRWWLDRVGGVEWSRLTGEQKTLLSAWYLLALAESPSSTEPLPLEFRTVLAQFTAITHREVTNSNTRKF